MLVSGLFTVCLQILGIVPLPLFPVCSQAGMGSYSRPYPYDALLGHLPSSRRPVRPATQYTAVHAVVLNIANSGICLGRNVPGSYCQDALIRRCAWRGQRGNPMAQSARVPGRTISRLIFQTRYDSEISNVAALSQARALRWPREVCRFGGAFSLYMTPHDSSTGIFTYTIRNPSSFANLSVIFRCPDRT